MVSPAVVTNSVSSSSTLWATASKEWVIAPKPKPGRKPKKDLSNSAKSETDVVDTKGRRVQNRAAQRAFRERKQSQLAELQARVQSYEQGEIERNVALQNIAKRLKEENESLRSENALLKEKLANSGVALVPFTDNDRKRPSGDYTSIAIPASKRAKAISDQPPASSLILPFSSSPPSTVSSPDSSGTSDTTCSPLPTYDIHTDTIHTVGEGENPKTMPTNDAWRQLKSHPNVSFADLALLAEVVSRRSKCTGPRVVISPALGSITPERTTSPPVSNLPAGQEPILLTDPHAHYREKELVRSNGLPPSPRLVPQEVLISCGRQRVREVQTDAVRAALRLLDAKFT
ncbi:hypothetical protein C0991_000097 [Blastosporella zonata]|nr:hypothetical protein C0991_000097 [Blastosporella zonata]